MQSFKLTRHFSLLSLVLMIAAASLLGTLVKHYELNRLEVMAEKRNAATTQTFARLLQVEIEALTRPTVDARTTLEKQAARGSLEATLTPLLRNSDILKLKIFDLRGLTVFSTDEQDLMDNEGENPAFQEARRNKIRSELVNRNHFKGLSSQGPPIDLVSSYVPVIHEGRVIAVIEVYQDVSQLLEEINESFWSIWIIIFSVLSALYLGQLLVIRRAQAIIGRQEDLLASANRELDHRVTERSLQVENLLRQQQIIFDNAHVGILLLQKRRILRCNQRVASMFGYPHPDEIIGKTTEIFYGTPENFENAGRTGYRQLSEHGFATFETLMYKRDGTPIMVMQSGRPVDPEQVLEGVSIWVYTDISDIKRAEDEQRIAAVAFESQEGMLVTDAQGVILRVNKTFTDITGYTADEVVGKTPNILKSARHNDAFYAEMWRSLLQTGLWSGEVWNRRKSGEEFPEWLTISAVKSNSGEVTHYVGTHIDITDRKRSEERIQHLAFYDQLTGLPNRTLLNDRLRHAINVSARSGQYGAVLFLDLDHFKSLNDTAGHDQGDQLLRDVAQRLSSVIRQSDTVARLGGDEFVIVLVELAPARDAAGAIVEGICRKLRETLRHNYLLNGHEFRCSASIGATLFQGSNTNIDELLKQADLAMYKSKESGRNNFSFFDESMEASVLAHLRLEADLRHALEREQFTLCFQAQVDGRSEAIVGAEILIRWQHPERGLLSPDSFIPQAEANGQIIPIGDWVLTQACRQLARWRSQDAFRQLSLAVNVSAHQFLQPEFIDKLKETLLHTGAPADRLKLELTESVFVSRLEEIIVKMEALKTIGIGFSLDDFGTGYSSLSSMSRLPLEQIKIDRSFVMGLEDNEREAAICAATVSLAHNLQIDVVAEGVETEAQRYFLTTVHGCDLLQGYLYSRPIPLPEFEALCRGKIGS